MPTCKDVYESCSEYYDDEMRPEERQEFESHLEACPPCRTFYVGFEMTIAVARDAMRVDPPLDLSEQLMRGLHDKRAG